MRERSVLTRDDSPVTDAEIAAGHAAVGYVNGLIQGPAGPTTQRTLEQSIQSGERRLGRFRRFLATLGNPQDGLRCVHVGGTSGKGSVAAKLAAGLSAAGLRTGLHCTPYLQTAIEKFECDGRLARPSELVELVDWIRPYVDRFAATDPDGPPTYGMVWVALTLEYFRRAGVDIAVMEVGAGGRFDLTNVVQPRSGADYQRGSRSPQEPGRHAGNRGLAQGRHLQGRCRRHVRTAPAAGPATSTRRRGRRESTSGGSAAGRRRLSFAQQQPGRGGAGGHRHGSPAHARGQARGRPGTSGRPLRTHARSPPSTWMAPTTVTKRSALGRVIAGAGLAPPASRPDRYGRLSRRLGSAAAAPAPPRLLGSHRAAGLPEAGPTRQPARRRGRQTRSGAHRPGPRTPTMRCKRRWRWPATMARSSPAVRSTSPATCAPPGIPRSPSSANAPCGPGSARTGRTDAPRWPILTHRPDARPAAMDEPDDEGLIYTLEEATQLLPEVRRIVGRLQRVWIDAGSERRGFEAAQTSSHRPRRGQPGAPGAGRRPLGRAAPRGLAQVAQHRTARPRHRPHRLPLRDRGRRRLPLLAPRRRRHRLLAHPRRRLRQPQTPASRRLSERDPRREGMAWCHRPFLVGEAV